MHTVNGETVIVEFVQHEILESPQILYNFEVDGNHNYYVAESVNASVKEFVLAHNAGDCGAKTKTDAPKVKKGQDHHIASDKSKKYTPEYEKIFDKADMSLQDEENIIDDLANHVGRHTNKYHDTVTETLQLATENATKGTEAAGKLKEALDRLKEMITSGKLPLYK